jgi:hypothetical protein
MLSTEGVHIKEGATKNQFQIEIVVWDFFLIALSMLSSRRTTQLVFKDPEEKTLTGHPPFLSLALCHATRLPRLCYNTLRVIHRLLITVKFLENVVKRGLQKV